MMPIRMAQRVPRKHRSVKHMAPKMRTEPSNVIMEIVRMPNFLMMPRERYFNAAIIEIRYDTFPAVFFTVCVDHANQLLMCKAVYKSAHLSPRSLLALTGIVNGVAASISSLTISAIASAQSSRTSNIN